jgi:zinc transport system substrate-binding protein
MRRLTITLLLLIAPDHAIGHRLAVVASIHPIADIAERVGGSLAEVQVLLPAGTSPHTFEPTPREMRLLSKADLFLAVGLGLEHWAGTLVDAADGRGRQVMVSKGVPLLGGDPPNPHIWLDPLRAKVIAANIANAYEHLLPDRAPMIVEQRRRVSASLDSLHHWIAEMLDKLTTRRFVAFHPAWVYFAERYGLEQVAVIEEFPGKEPSPRYLAQLIGLTREVGVPVIFAEPQLNPKVARILAEEAGVGVAVVDPLGGEGIPGRECYMELMRWNTEVMVRAMTTRTD